MKKSSNIMMLFLLTTLLGCASTEWQEFPPEEFQGRFTQVSDGIIQGYEKPIIIKINNKTLQYHSPEDESNQTYPILKVSKTEHHIVIFCGNKNDNHIADLRYDMFWGEDNYLYISEIVSTGYNNEDGIIEVGRFTDSTRFN
ncbi:hypothetical protein JYU23_01155 [bacterium AH-315-C07]|nr:hypothetical protein [bacterium AH-315-C07]